MPTDDPSFDAIVDTMKRAIAALRAADVRFLLAGSLAVWAQGGPEQRNDLDFVVKPQDAERALEALAEAGMRPEDPPEDWLYKAWDDDVLVDVIFDPRGVEVTDETLDRGQELHVLAITVQVMSLEDVLTSKLFALDERSADYRSVPSLARAVREQVDWPLVRRRTEDSPFARAFFVIVEGLGVLADQDAVGAAGAGGD